MPRWAQSPAQPLGEGWVQPVIAYSLLIVRTRGEHLPRNLPAPAVLPQGSLRPELPGPCKRVGVSWPQVTALETPVILGPREWEEIPGDT